MAKVNTFRKLMVHMMENGLMVVLMDLGLLSTLREIDMKDYIKKISDMVLARIGIQMVRDTKEIS
jgi:hypothetical protein